MSNIVLRSRLTGRPVGRMPDRVVPDLFEQQEDAVGAPSRVVPDGLRADGSLSFIGRVAEPVEAKALRQIVEPLERASTWPSWGEVLPLVSHADERARLLPLEREALTHLQHLQFVCHRPRMHLRIEEERLPVAHARRIPPRAVATLVSRPGDWEHRTLRGVHPSRILAVQVEDECNLYENRLAARLVDRLLQWTTSRVDELTRLHRLADERRDFQDATRGSRFRGQRLFKLWGKLFADDRLVHDVADTLAILERLQRSLQALLDSPLYREIPRSASVPVALVPTNILANDPHYRKIAVLWRAWVHHGRLPEPTREELRVQRQAECRGFDAFALLVLVHALRNLGYEAQANAVLPGAADLHGPTGRARLEARDGVFHVRIGQESLRVLSVLARAEREEADAIWEQIRALADPREDSLVLLLGSPEDVARMDSRTARSLSGWERPRVLLISPWSLDSVERVARVLRTWEAPKRLVAYPERREIRGDPGLGLPPWLKRIDGWVARVAPVDEKQRRDFEAQCVKRKANLEREQATARTAQRAFEVGRIRAVDELLDLVRTESAVDRWMRCPVCGSVDGNDFQPRPAAGPVWTQWAWWCCCRSCGAGWGLRLCNDCEHTYPVIQPRVPCHLPEHESPTPAWLDRTFGRDLWAEPCWKAGATDTFRCAHCDSRGQRLRAHQ